MDQSVSFGGIWGCNAFMHVHRPLADEFKPRGYFSHRILGPDGQPITDWEIAKNGNTTVGLTDILSVYFAAGTPKTTWYIGLIDNSGFSALNASDTMASHTGWSENVNYTQATRPQWTPLVASGASITNTSPVVFTINATPSIYGAFLCSNNTLSGTTGVLWATGAFNNVQGPLVSGQSFQVSYTIPAS